MRWVDDKRLPDLVVKEGLSTFVSKPPRIVVRKTLSKADHEYYTFLTDLGAKRLLAKASTCGFIRSHVD